VALGMIAYRAMQAPVVFTTEPGRIAALAPLGATGYLTAARDLPVGTLVRDDDFVTKALPPGRVPDGALPALPDAVTSIRGGMIRRDLGAGSAVTVADILRPGDRGYLGAVLAPGSLAIAAGVDAAGGVTGLVWPGDQVDVILTREIDQTADSRARRVVGETVLRNIRVIAIDPEIVQGANAANAVVGQVGRTVTLQVNSDQAERLTVAQRLGRLALAIRGTTEPAEGTDEHAAGFGADASPALGSAAEGAGARVRVIQGDKITDMTFH